MTSRRARRALQQPFAPAWSDLLARFYPQWPVLHPDERTRMQDRIRIFRAETDIEGAAGVEVTTEMEVAVAAAAALVVLGFPAERLPNVASVVVHSGTVRRTVRQSLGGGIIREGPLVMSGEALPTGPVMIAWPQAEREARHPEWGRQVIIHEFSHKFDMAAGSADGVPPIGDRSERDRFVATLTRHLTLLRDGARSLRGYAATNPTELFAVASELFFTDPERMRDGTPDLYRAMVDAYRQDPAHRLAESRR